MYNQERVNKLYPGATIYEAMEVWTLPKHKKTMLESICKEKKYFGQLKKDGNWYEYVKGANGENYIFSRGVSTKTGLPVESIANVPHLEKIFKDLPNDTVIIGEIYYEGETSNEVRSIMGCLPPKAKARQKEKGNIHFHMFDMIRFAGNDITAVGALERYNKLSGVYDDYVIKGEEVELAEVVFDDLFEFIGNAIENGEEGAVLKLKTAPYSEGKRPAWSMIKVKKQDNVDVVCLGFEDATMEYTGDDLDNWKYWLIQKQVDGQWQEYKRFNGAHEAIRSPEFRTVAITKPYYLGVKTSIKIGAYKDWKMIPIGTVSSGLNDALRRKITDNPEEYIGRVIECDCMEVTADSLRHPIFKRFRDDKKAESCTFTSIFD